MKTKYFPPAHKADGFHCPHCDVFAEQTWYRLDAIEFGKSIGIGEIPNLFLAVCRRCRRHSIWQNEKIIYPVFSIAPMPSDEMPADTKADYLEARLIVNHSPRAACALLRLGLQKLTINLGEKGKDLNTDIKELVAKGLPPRIQKALDSVRVIGNEAIHPGTLDLKDDVSTASAIFELVNMIVEVMITQPKEVDAIYAKLPESKKDEITKRDGK